MYIQYEPPQDLKHLICFFYEMEHLPEDGPLQPLLPSATEVNGWQYSGRWRVMIEDKNEKTNNLLPEFYMVGQQTVAYQLTAEQGVAGIFGAALQPGTIFQLIGRPAHHFTNNPIDLTTLFKPELIVPYIRSYTKAKSTDERMNIVIRFYRQFSIPPTYGVYKEALQIIYQQKGCISVRELCHQLKINERYLQREFRDKVGVSPLTYLKIIRFNNVFTMLSLSEEKQHVEPLAMLFMYYDVSHFNKTHKKYFGVAPSKLMLDRLCLLQELIIKGPYLTQVQEEQ
jgi:AraC-like DNA-binding protein